MEAMAMITYRDDIFKADLPWYEIQGLDDPKGLFHPSTAQPAEAYSHYSNAGLVRQAAEIVLGEVQQEITSLEQKILQEQPAERKWFFSRKRLKQFEGVMSRTQIKEYVQRMKKREIVAIDLMDSVHYSALVTIGKELGGMSRGGSINPYVMGRRFDEVYRQLQQN